MLQAIRQLADDGIEQMIAIDAGHTGRARRRFFEKRLAAVRHHPDDYVLVGIMRNASLAGFAIARLQRGEFGRQQCVAVLDAIGVDPGSQEAGVGRELMLQLEKELRQRQVTLLQSQVAWTSQRMLGLMQSSGFRLAPRLVLERSTAQRFDEASEDV